MLRIEAILMVEAEIKEIPLVIHHIPDAQIAMRVSTDAWPLTTIGQLSGIHVDSNGIARLETDNGVDFPTSDCGVQGTIHLITPGFSATNR
jgi:hypothetical protein